MTLKSETLFCYHLLTCQFHKHFVINICHLDQYLKIYHKILGSCGLKYLNLDN